MAAAFAHLSILPDLRLFCNKIKYYLFVETRTCCLSQTSLVPDLLPQPFQCWDCKNYAVCPTLGIFWKFVEWSSLQFICKIWHQNFFQILIEMYLKSINSNMCYVPKWLIKLLMKSFTPKSHPHRQLHCLCLQIQTYAQTDTHT